MQAMEAEHKKLEHMQSVFMHKLRSLADQGQKLPGVYKFVVMEFSDEPKLVLQEGDSKNIREYFQLLLKGISLYFIPCLPSSPRLW